MNKSISSLIKEELTILQQFGIWTWKDYRLEIVEVQKLIPTEDGYIPWGVYYKRILNNEQLLPIAVNETYGNYYIRDGHHRHKALLKANKLYTEVLVLVGFKLIA